MRWRRQLSPASDPLRCRGGHSPSILFDHPSLLKAGKSVSIACSSRHQARGTRASASRSIKRHDLFLQREISESASRRSNRFVSVTAVGAFTAQCPAVLAVIAFDPQRRESKD